MITKFLLLLLLLLIMMIMTIIMMPPPISKLILLLPFDKFPCLYLSNHSLSEKGFSMRLTGSDSQHGVGLSSGMGRPEQQQQSLKVFFSFFREIGKPNYFKGIIKSHYICQYLLLPPCSTKNCRSCAESLHSTQRKVFARPRVLPLFYE